MPTGLLGVAIGNDNLKITSCTGASPVSFVSSRLPENLIKNNRIVSDDVFTGFFKETLKTNKISTRDCALVLPTDSCYIKRVKLPLMTPAQLAVNLPFEFHDYITENTGDYLYDYAVISKDEKNLDLMAAAFSKKDSLEYQQAFKASGRKLVRIVPDAICLQNILQRSTEPDRDYAILDLGHIQSRLHFFRGGYFEITRIMDFGGSTLAKTIADDQGIDTHIAQLRLEQDDPDTLGLTAMTGQYDTYSTELMRVLNFYNYNHAGNSIDALYVCGGCSGISVLLDSIVNATGLRVRRVSELCTGLTEEQAEYVDKAPQCYGIMLQD